MIKVLFVSSLFDPYEIGGAESYLRNLVQNLEPREIRCAVVSSRPLSRMRRIFSYEFEDRGLMFVTTLPTSTFSMKVLSHVKSPIRNLFGDRWLISCRFFLLDP